LPADPRTLSVLTWYDYFAPDMIDRFESEFDVEVVQVHFETDHDRDRMLVNSNGHGFDVAVVDEVTIRIYRRKQWIRPVDARDVPNLRHVDPRWWAQSDDIDGYAVPYFWGTTGIIYRTDLAPEAIDSWMKLFRPSNELSGRIVMLGDPVDLPLTALQALGLRMDHLDDDAFAAVEALLAEQKVHVRHYGYIAIDDQSELLTGEVIATQGFNGDYYALLENNRNLAYILPTDGCLLWLDTLVVASASKEPDLALAFVNFFNRPDVAAANAEYENYATPNLAARDLLDPETLDDTVIYPDEKDLQRCLWDPRLPLETVSRFNRIFAELTR
jgi:spermidine/putrescine transport system substrate-binding protein